MLGLVLVALSLGASNLAAAIGIGLEGVDNRTRVRVGAVFGLFEAGMPVVGLAIGRVASDSAGSAGQYLGAGLLLAVGVYTVATGPRGRPDAPTHRRHTSHRLLITGLALSLDNLVVGFALSSFHIAILVAGAVIALVSIAMSLVGLEIGCRMARRVESRAQFLGGIVLIVVGIALAAGVLG